MPHTLFIMGAGCSLSAGVPLMNDFIDRAYDLLQQDRDAIDAEAFDLAFALIQGRLPDLQSKSVVNLDNIESVFSLIEMGRLLRRLPRTPPHEIDAAATAIRRVLAETVELYCRFPIDSDGAWYPHEPYRMLIERLESAREKSGRSTYSFITFNYDLALDFTLHWASIGATSGLSEPSLPGIPLLKLHGSVNWAGCPVCGTIREVPVGSIFRAYGLQRKLASTTMPVRAMRTLTKLPPHCPEAATSTEPALVPPSWNKTQYHNQFARIWQHAAAEIAKAEHIYVVGYSMPVSDAFFRDLLALGLNAQTRLRSFTVVNPDVSVFGRIQALLGPAATNRFWNLGMTFEDFVAQFKPPQ